MPKFAHLPLLLNPNGKGKIKKRDGDKLGFPVFPLEWKTFDGDVLKGYRESGYFPEAFINILSFLGWNPGTEQEIFSMEELIESFSLENVSNNGCRFDLNKAKWFNKQYIRTKTDDELAKLYQPILKIKGLNFNLNYISKVCGLVKERIGFVEELWEQSFYFFVAPTTYDEKMIKKVWKNTTFKIMSDFSCFLNNKWNTEAHSFKQIVEEYVISEQLNLGEIMNTLRLLLIGSSIGTDLFVTSELLGKEEVLKRIELGIKKIQYANF
jgi:glutamyl-tRNA synthetase